MAKSLLELVQQNLNREEVSAEEESAINSFEETYTMDEQVKRIAADVIGVQVKKGTKFGGAGTAVREFMTMSNMVDSYFDEDERQAMDSLDLTPLEAHLNADFGTKALIVSMIAKAQYEGVEIPALVGHLTRGLATGSPEEKKAFVVAEDKRMFGNMGKAAMAEAEDLGAFRSVSQVVEEAVYKSSGSFLEERVFAPHMSQASVTFDRTGSTSTLAFSFGAAVASPEPSKSAVTFADADEVQTPLQRFGGFTRSVETLEQREAISLDASNAVEELERVSGTNNKYNMSSNADDTVDIQKDDDGKYTIIPGGEFTGIIKMKRAVGPGEEPSFDVIEFKDGAMISGVEGTRGESKIKNMDVLQREMLERHHAPMFVFHDVQRQQEVHESYSSRVFSNSYDAYEPPHEDIVPAEVTSQSLEGLEARRYQLRDVERAVAMMVDQNINAVKKAGMHVPVFGSDSYHREKAALVFDVTNIIMNNFAGQSNLDISSLEKNKQKLISATERTVGVYQDALQTVLDDARIKGHPEKVRDVLVDDHAELVEGIAKTVQQEYDRQVEVAVLREKMVEQMQHRFPAEAGNVYGSYVAYRDEVVKNIVNEAMLDFPEELDAKTIRDKSAAILHDFEGSYNKHDGAIRDFLKAHKDSWVAADVKTAKGPADLSVWESVAKDTAEYTPLSAEAVKEKAVQGLMSDITRVLKGDIKAAKWETVRFKSYHVERDALAEQLSEDIAKKLMADPTVTSEMLYSNRDEVIKAAREVIVVEQNTLDQFLGDSKNKNKDAATIKEQWRAAEQDVATKIGDALVGTLAKGRDMSVQLYDDALQRLQFDLLEAAKENVAAKKKSIGEYYVERDALAVLMVTQTIEDLKKKGVSGAELEANHDIIRDCFVTSLEEHHDTIQERLEYVYQHQPSLDGGGSIVPSVRREQIAEGAVGVLEERNGEVSIAEDVAEKFRESADKLVREQRAHKQATQASRVLKAASHLEGHVGSPGQTPRKVVRQGHSCS